MINVSIVTAVFNRRETIGDALNSVLSQTHPFVESIVIDGASTDGTLNVLEKFRTKLGFLISEPDNGIYDALNKGIKHSTGDVIGFLHADDVFENNEVVGRVAAIFQDSSIDAVYGDLVYVREDNIKQVIRYWKSGRYDVAALKRGWMPPHPTFYVRRSIYDRLGGFDTRYGIAADYDTILRFLFVYKIRAAYIPEVLVRMRAGGISNRSLRTILRKSLEDIDVLRRNNVGGVGTLLNKNLRKVSQFWRR
jgi:glycosyltransferase involved in cell wall biosynthesis